MENIEFELLESDEKYLAGDFRSKECVELLQRCDLVVTNPPFSLFREFVALMERFDKKYLIIGNKNAVTYKEIFPLIRDNRLWLGHNSVATFMTDCGGIQKFGNIGWFTNLDVLKRHEELPLNPFNHFSTEKFPMYDNYCAWNIDKVKDIPCDDCFELEVDGETYGRLKSCYGDDCELIEVIE